jgi:hypothetical protein
MSFTLAPGTLWWADCDVDMVGGSVWKDGKLLARILVEVDLISRTAF